MENSKSLSQREKEVAALLLQGKSNKQIALALKISERTVEFHLQNIYSKLQVNSRVELVIKLGKTTGAAANEQVESTVVIDDDSGHNGKQEDVQAGWEQPARTPTSATGKEFAMSKEVRTILSAVTAVMGIILIIGGIITDKNGAVVVGLCVSVAAMQQWITMRIQANQGNK